MNTLKSLPLSVCKCSLHLRSNSLSKYNTLLSCLNLATKYFIFYCCIYLYITDSIDVFVLLNIAGCFCCKFFVQTLLASVLLYFGLLSPVLLIMLLLNVEQVFCRVAELTSNRLTKMLRAVKLFVFALIQIYL